MKFVFVFMAFSKEKMILLSFGKFCLLPPKANYIDFTELYSISFIVQIHACRVIIVTVNVDYIAKLTKKKK